MTVYCYIRTVMKEKRYSIEDLVRLTGLSRRTIRFYIQEGLLDPPSGRGRGGVYFEHHLERLRQIQELRRRGLKLASIRKMISDVVHHRIQPPAEQRDVWIRIEIRPGLELHVRHDVEERIRSAVQEIVKFAKAIIEREEV